MQSKTITEKECFIADPPGGGGDHNATFTETHREICLF